MHPDTPQLFTRLFNQTVAGIPARIGLHLCFGNFAGRPVARRRYRPLFPHILDTTADELALEFANREMAEVELCAEISSAGKAVAAGVVDVKNYHVESVEATAGRIEEVLRHVPVDRLTVTPDCGLSQTARWAARAKLKALVEGARLVSGRTPS